MPQRARRRLLFFAAAGLLAAAGCRPAIDAQLQEAQSLVAEGQPLAALPLLERVVREHPEDGAANLLLGQALIQLGRTSPAVPPLSRAMESERYAVPAALLLASAQLGEGQPRDALATVDQILVSHPDQPVALRIRATARLQAGEPEPALADIRHLMEVAPDDPQAPLMLGTALTWLGRLDEAEQFLVALESDTREQPAGVRHAHACAALASFLATGRQDAERAERAWLGCIDGHPTDPTVVQGATSFFDQHGQRERSIALLRRTLELAPEALGVRLGLARRLAAIGEPEQGDALLAGWAESSAEAQAWQALATFRRERGETAGARAALEQGLSDPGGEADALRFQYASLLIDLGEHDAATATIAEIETPELADHAKGHLLLALGDPAAALEALERVTRIAPSDARAHHLTGLAAQALGQIDRALHAFNTAMEIDPNATDAALAAARLHAALGDPRRTIELLHLHRAARVSGRREALLLEAQALAALEQPAAAAGLLERHLGRVPGDPEALGLLAQVLDAAQGPAAALERIDQARAAGFALDAPEHLAVLERHGSLAIRAGQPERAFRLIDALLARRPEAVELHVLRGIFSAAVHDADAAEASFRKAVSLGPRHPVALVNLGRWLSSQGRAEEAIEWFERAEREAPGQYDAGFQVARILAAAGRVEEAEPRLRAVLEANPLHAGACNDLAWLLAQGRRRLDEALTLARRAVRLQPGGATLDTLGWVLLQRGEVVEAVATLEQAVARDPQDPGFRYRLGLALDRSGQPQEARQAYRDALAGGAFPEAAAARTALARLEDGTG